MRKLLILMLIIIIPYSLLFAEGETSEGTTENTGSSATLNLRGYKIGLEKTPTITLTDALSGSLEIVAGNDVNITDYVDKFLGSTPTSQFDPDRVLFSYRVVGNTVPDGYYQLKITLSNLIQDVEESSSSQEKGVIKTSYNLANLSYSFHGVSSNNYNGDKIEKHSESNKIEAAPGEEKDYLTSNFKIVDADNNGETFMPWVHRGAVSMTIDSADYNGTDIPLGTYKATVEVTLEAK